MQAPPAAHMQRSAARRAAAHPTPAPARLAGCSEKVQVILSPTGQIKSEIVRCLIAEFMGTMLFQVFGGAAPPKDTTAPAANGFALVCISERPPPLPLPQPSPAQPSPAAQAQRPCLAAPLSTHLQWRQSRPKPPAFRSSGHRARPLPAGSL